MKTRLLKRRLAKLRAREEKVRSTRTRLRQLMGKEREREQHRNKHKPDAAKHPGAVERQDHNGR